MLLETVTNSNSIVLSRSTTPDISAANSLVTDSSYTGRKLHNWRSDFKPRFRHDGWQPAARWNLFNGKTTATDKASSHLYSNCCRVVYICGLVCKYDVCTHIGTSNYWNMGKIKEGIGGKEAFLLKQNSILIHSCVKNVVGSQHVLCTAARQIFVNPKRGVICTAVPAARNRDSWICRTGICRTGKWRTENDGLKNDGVEQEQTYVLHTIKWTQTNVYDT